MSEIKIGDRVRCVKVMDKGVPVGLIGHEGVVTQSGLDVNYPLTVDFEEYGGEHAMLEEEVVVLRDESE